MNTVELVGYVASILVAVSLMMSNIWKLRWINLLGAVIFSAYGLLVGAYPVFAVNFLIAIVNIYYIVQLAKKKDYFSYIRLRDGKDALLNKFLDFYGKDIRKFFPDLNVNNLKDPYFIVILRNLIPVGLFVYELHPDGIIDVKVDYVTPDYRDLKNAHFMYNAKASTLQGEGYRTFISKSRIKQHQDYLKKIGFEQDSSDKELFRKAIVNE